MSLFLKQGPDGCRIAGVRPESLVAVFVAHEIYKEHSQNLVWTCCTDAKHQTGSLHYVGLAVDLGFPLESQRPAIEQKLKARLGEDFDVVVEGDHYHIEFQPKRGLNLQ